MRHSRSDAQSSEQVVYESKPSHLPMGEVVIGRYTVFETVGAGNYGAVSAARDKLTDDVVAVKWLRPSLDEVRDECTAMRGLLRRTTRAPRLLDEGSHAGRPFLVIEWVHGEPFPGPLRRADSAWEELRDVVGDMFRAVEEVHRLGLLHLDLKPDNVRVLDGRCRLLDLGLAHAARLDHRYVGGELRVRPRGVTRRYAPPEQIRGELVGADADLFAVAKMVAEAMVGSPMEEDQPRFLQALPEDVRPLFKRLLSRDPSRRPSSATEVLEALGESASLPALPSLGRPATGHADLEALFGGLEPVLHQRSRAARELWSRTSGDVALVERELSYWVRSGWAEFRDGVVVVPASRLHDLENDAPLARAPETEQDLSEDEQRALMVLDMLWPNSLPPIVDTVVPSTDWAGMQERGLVVALPDGRMRSSCAVHQHDLTTVALDDLVDVCLGRDCASPWMIDKAPPAQALRYVLDGPGTRPPMVRIANLQAALASVRRMPEQMPMVLLKQACVLLFLLCDEVDTPRGHDIALLEMDRLLPTPWRERLRKLILACQRAGRVGGKGALLELDNLRAFEEPELERARQSARLRAASKARLEGVQRHVLHSLRDYAQGDVAERFAWHTWCGRVAYDEHDFEAAAAAHLQALELASSTSMRARVATYAASAFLEAGRYAEALEQARQARQRAAEVAMPRTEARAIWIARSAQYRMGECDTPQRGDVDAMVQLGIPHLPALLALIEAMVVIRQDPTDPRAIEFLEIAARGFRASAVEPGVLLTDALKAGMKPELTGLAVSVETRVRAAEGTRLYKDFDWQSIGVLAMFCRTEERVAWARRLCECADPKDKIRETWSPDEILSALAAHKAPS